MKLSAIMIRSLILYILVIFAVRLMGKRQLGELQPSELVITILVSNIATLPIEDIDIPLLVGVTPILCLVCFEVIVSWLGLKSPKLRRIISGSPKIIIQNGKLNPDILNQLRFSVDDLMMALRGSGVFNIEDVQFAIVETTGSVSIMRKNSVESANRSDLGIMCRDSDPPLVIVSDGKILTKPLHALGLNEQFVKNVLNGVKLGISDVFIMTADTAGSCAISDKTGKIRRISKGGTENDKG